MNEDMSNLMEQINNMMKNNQIPDDIKNIINSMSQNSSNSGNTDSQVKDTSSSENTSSDSSMPEFDMATIMKLKRVMESMKSSSNDPRANLLKSLKPYLKDSRKEKVDQYIQIFGMSKVFEMLNPLGGDSRK
ncbi:hypothetical protein [Duodenibacillus massiliensis]|uniref:hypothetical protein n=1 Tax=Duodenibacillus massiliensis TaxID=1852381 RepID=UPI003077EF93